MAVTGSLPPDLRYTRDHMWVRIEEPLARIGITSIAQAALGEVVYIDVPRLGLSLKLGEAFGWIESDKTVTDLFPPLAGIVVLTNTALAQTPGEINRDPYGAGWICVIEGVDRRELATLLDATGYAALIGRGR